jgi:hypothetical protein
MITKVVYNGVCFAIHSIAGVSVLLQRSLINSDPGGTRHSQTIIHSALCADRSEKIPCPSVKYINVFNGRQDKG